MTKNMLEAICASICEHCRNGSYKRPGIQHIFDNRTHTFVGPTSVPGHFYRNEYECRAILIRQAADDDSGA